MALVSASRSTLSAPITVSARAIRRCRAEVESAVYFTCLAAIDNAAKHAGPAEVSVDAWDPADALHFTVSDTGRGFDPDGTPSGAGLSNMHDRIAAVGGTLTVCSDAFPRNAATRQRPDPGRAQPQDAAPRLSSHPAPADPTGGLSAEPGTSA